LGTEEAEGAILQAVAVEGGRKQRGRRPFAPASHLAKKKKNRRESVKKRRGERGEF